MPQSRRPERPRSSHLDHSASFRATKPNKASRTLMLAAASICATDVLERHLVPPGFECCERELLGRSWRRDWGMRKFRRFSGSGQNCRHGKKRGLDVLGRSKQLFDVKNRFFSIQNGFCLKLDAKSVPEALATSIRILLMFSIVLAHSLSLIHI